MQIYRFENNAFEVIISFRTFGVKMNEPQWSVNSIDIKNLRSRENSGENVLVKDIEIKVVQYSDPGEAMEIDFCDLSGVFARTGPKKMKFHLDWPSCVKTMKSADEAGMKLITDGKILWMEINNAIDSVIKNSH